MKKSTSIKSAKATKSTIDNGVLAAAEGEVLETTEGTEENGEETPEEGDAPAEGAEEKDEYESDPDLVPTETKNEATGHTIPMQMGEKTYFITQKALLVLMATQEGKEVRKQLSSQTKEQREQAKKDAAAARANKQSTVAEVGKELGFTDLDLKKAGMAQFIKVDKETMSIVGVTFKSPIGQGGARYYVNHGKAMSAVEKDKRREFAKRVALAASMAAQKAGLEAMRKFAPEYGLVLPGLNLEVREEA